MQLKYKSKDSSEHVFKQIKIKADNYFAENKFHKHANISLWLKCAVLVALLIPAYYYILHSGSFLQLAVSYVLFGWIFLILGINMGHDAAHHCLTGHRKTDDFIFKLVFGLQGLNGYMWQKRHNNSHHIFPNIYDNDTDMEMTGLIILNPKQKVHAFHKYQHVYAPFLYMLSSLIYIFFQDFALFLRKKQANLKTVKVPAIEWVKLFMFKIIYICIFLVIPTLINPAVSFAAVLSAFLIMHFIGSLFLAFTFFISHHVTEVEYVDAAIEEQRIANSWCEHQITTTIDFNPNSKIANFLFGGFNLHIAHHIFPDVSHIYYPALTKIIRETLDENDLHWYKSYTFFKGMRSHLRHLKITARDIMAEKELSL